MGVWPQGGALKLISALVKSPPDPHPPPQGEVGDTIDRRIKLET